MSSEVWPIFEKNIHPNSLYSGSERGFLGMASSRSRRMPLCTHIQRSSPLMAVMEMFHAIFQA